MTFLVSDIRTGEVYSRYQYVTTDTPGVKGVATMSNGEVYYIFSMSTLSIYNVFFQKTRMQITIYSKTSKLIVMRITKKYFHQVNIYFFVKVRGMVFRLSKR